MTALDHHNVAIAAAGRAPGAVWARTVDAVARLFRSWKNRSAMRRLSDLSDHELADIGLTRDDLRIAGRLPMAIDPTVRLAEIVSTRSGLEDAARRVY